MKKLLTALLFAVLACQDQTATQYVGTVMTDATPEAAAAFTLTLFSRTDTSFSGVVELGPPAAGTGTAYAWHEAGELRIATVAAAGADTILWTSRLTDEGLGGRFEVTGGARTGQGGTWRARHTRGPAATPATLQMPQRLAPPPLSAVWPLALVLVVAASLSRWIRRAPQPGIGDTTAWSTPATAGSKSGLGGWLACFVVGQTIAAGAIVARHGDLRAEYAGGMSVGAAVTGMQPLVFLETLVQLLTPGLALAGIVLIVRRSRCAPRYWFAYLAFSAAYLAVDLLAMAQLAPELQRLLGPGYAGAAGAGGAADRAMLWRLVMSLVWALYWVRSARVRATFGAAALDNSAGRGGSVPSGPGTAADVLRSPTAGWRRVVLRTAGALAAVAAIVMAGAAWQTRVRPYAVPAATDIRKPVAGHWAWSTDAAGCANAHIIGFSDDGSVMTIVQPARDTTAADTTTYDVERVTQSAVRGAIRGESRLTSDGRPVVWDLVLVGPDEYRWRRTDWSSPWGYTPGIVRCPAGTAATRATR